MSRYVVVALLAAPFIGIAAASATIVGGGGAAATDCLTVFDAPVNTPKVKPHDVKCVDGDPSCDADGIVNGICQIQVAVCANSTFNSAKCSLDGVGAINVDHSADDGDPKFDPEFQALQTRIDSSINPPSANQDECSGTTNFHVPIMGPFKNSRGLNVCTSNFKTISLTSVSEVIGGKVYVDRDKIKLTCVPAAAAAGGCDPQNLYTGTFDRIQRQIFNQSCALSGCHDSNSQAGGMILESGTSYGQLVGVDPGNAAAALAGWKRVTSGSSATSLLYHKVSWTLPNKTYGAKMPFGRRKLNSSLIKIIQLWIDGSTPTSGWVPGTF